MLNDDGTPIFYNEYLELWQNGYKKTNDENINEKYQEISKSLGHFAEINHQFISIFNTKSQKVLYLSTNYLEVMGYKCTEDEYKKYSVLYWMRDMPINQSWFFMQMSLFFRNTVQPLLKSNPDARSLKWYLHNFKLKPPGSYSHNISLTCSGLEFLTDGNMLIMLLIIKDVASLVKENTKWWAEFTINEKQRYHYHETNKNFVEGGVFSKREMEIFNLIKEGQNTKEIAEKLFISTHTVEKHRKNMLDLSGAKDFSSLIQICSIGNIV